MLTFRTFLQSREVSPPSGGDRLLSACSPTWDVRTHARTHAARTPHAQGTLAESQVAREEARKSVRAPGGSVGCWNHQCRLPEAADGPCSGRNLHWSLGSIAAHWNPNALVSVRPSLSYLPPASATHFPPNWCWDARCSKWEEKEVASAAAAASCEAQELNAPSRCWGKSGTEWTLFWHWAGPRGGGVTPVEERCNRPLRWIWSWMFCCAGTSLLDSPTRQRYYLFLSDCRKVYSLRRGWGKGDCWKRPLRYLAHFSFQDFFFFLNKRK